MALSENNLMSWSDIETLFSNLNTARKKFSFSTVSTPSNRGVTARTDVATSIERYIEDMSSSKYLTGVAVVNDTMPRVNELISPLVFTRMSTVISNINNTCAFDATNNGFSFNSSDNGFSFRTSNNSFTQNSHNASQRSSNNGFSENTSWCTSFRTSNNGFSQNTFRFVGA